MGAGHTYQLRSWYEKKTGVASHQLYVVDNYIGDWKFWNRANSDRGEALEFKTISRDVLSCPYRYLGCNFREIFGVSIPDEYMHERKDSGFRVKIYAQTGGEAILVVPASLVKGQLAAINPTVLRGESGFQSWDLKPQNPTEWPENREITVVKCEVDSWISYMADEDCASNGGKVVNTLP